MWKWITNHLPTLNLAATAFGGIASALIAFFAYQIDLKVQENAAKEARVSRSVALAQNLFADDAVKDALWKANSIEIKTGKMLADLDRNNLTPDDYKNAQIRAIGSLIGSDQDSMISQLFLVEQHIRRARNCMNPPDSNGETDQPESLCDPSTYLMLTGDVIHDLWWQLRPILTCDNRINTDKQIENFREVIRFVLESKDLDGVEIFDNSSEAQENGSNDNYRVIEFDSSHCTEYEKVIAQNNTEEKIAIENATSR